MNLFEAEFKPSVIDYQIAKSQSLL